MRKDIGQRVVEAAISGVKDTTELGLTLIVNDRDEIQSVLSTFARMKHIEQSFVMATAKMLKISTAEAVVFRDVCENTVTLWRVAGGLLTKDDAKALLGERGSLMRELIEKAAAEAEGEPSPSLIKQALVDLQAGEEASNSLKDL